MTTEHLWKVSFPPVIHGNGGWEYFVFAATAEKACQIAAFKRAGSDGGKSEPRGIKCRRIVQRDQILEFGKTCT